MCGVPWAGEAARRASMRIIQAILLLTFLGAVGLFAVQNTRSVTVDFWTWEVIAPIAAVIVAVYLLGMLSGWTVVAFVRRSLRRVAVRPSGSE
jgi:putative membrane protein